MTGMDFFLEPLSHAFMRRALLAGVSVAAAGGLLGMFVVQRGLAFLADGLAHATFGGIAFGLWLGATPDQSPWVALPLTVLVSVGIGAVRRRSGLGPDVATGVFFAVSLALGVIFLGLRPPSAPVADLESLLFGSLLASSPSTLWIMVTVALLTAAGLVWSWSRLAYATFDAELAELSGVKVAALESLLMALTAVVVVAGVRSVGVLLVSAFVVLPAATAHLLATRLPHIAALSLGLAVSAAFLGLIVSYHANLASGATIVILLGAAFFLALVFRRR
jgi:zinc transport system permease protein